MLDTYTALRKQARTYLRMKAHKSIILYTFCLQDIVENLPAPSPFALWIIAYFSTWYKPISQYSEDMYGLQICST